jgi:hypothetical protein
MASPVYAGSVNAAVHYFVMSMESEARAIARGLRWRDLNDFGFRSPTEAL